MYDTASGFAERSAEPVRFPGLRAAIGIALALGLGTAAQAASAGNLRVEGGRCAARVQIAAQDVHLSEVLARLAKTYGFQLSFQSASDPLVDFTGTGDLASVVTRLARDGNVSIDTRDGAGACEGRMQVTRVWVLSNGAHNVVPHPAPRANRRQAQNNHRRAPDAPVDPLYAQSHGAALVQQQGNAR